MVHKVTTMFKGLKQSESNSLVRQSQGLFHSSYDVHLDSVYSYNHSYKFQTVGLVTRLRIGLPKIRGLIPCRANRFFFFSAPSILALISTDWDCPPFEIG